LPNYFTPDDPEVVEVVSDSFWGKSGVTEISDKGFERDDETLAERFVCVAHGPALWPGGHEGTESIEVWSFLRSSSSRWHALDHKLAQR